MTDRTRKRYSTAFKRKVVQEVETGELSVQQARRLYDIGGGSTIYNWLDEFGKSESKTVYVQTDEETDPMSKLEEENKRLREEKKALESALAQAHLKQLAPESTIEVASDHFGVDVKKNFGTDPSSKLSSDGPSVERFSSADVPDEPDPSKPDPNDPTSNDPTSNDPTSKEPTSKEPMSNDPTSNDPTSNDPTSKEPTSKEPS